MIRQRSCPKEARIHPDKIVEDPRLVHPLSLHNSLEKSNPPSRNIGRSLRSQDMHNAQCNRTTLRVLIVGGLPSICSRSSVLEEWTEGELFRASDPHAILLEHEISVAACTRLHHIRPMLNRPQHWIASKLIIIVSVLVHNLFANARLYAVPIP